jgi:hypothetical protein
MNKLIDVKALTVLTTNLKDELGDFKGSCSALLHRSSRGFQLQYRNAPVLALKIAFGVSVLL